MVTHTSSRLRRVASGIPALALIALLPSATLAQSSNGRVEANPTKAAELHQKADQLLDTQLRKNWTKVADLLEEAAALRAFEDPVAVEELWLAGEMRHVTGRLAEAQGNLEAGAEQALRNGAVLQSAQLFLRAAFVAQERGQSADAVALGNSAKLLAGSPHLAEADCDCILERLIEAKNADRASPPKGSGSKGSGPKG